jgi:acetylornithine/succinyldiaminopimelate/putrescine aminotransferase
LPVSACIGSKDVMGAWAARGGSAIHTATHFASPLGCAAALATLKEIRAARLPLRARSLGQRFQNKLAKVVVNAAARVTGLGLMVGIHVEGGAARALGVSRALLERGYITLTGGSSGDVLTLTPPLNVEERLLDAFVPELARALASV